MRRARRFLRLSAGEQWLLIKASMLLWVVKVGLVLLPFRSLRRFLDKLAGLPFGFSRPEQSSAEQAVWAVELAGRLMPQASTCLTKALTAQVLLLRRGHPALVHIGTVKGVGGEFQAHAWVESGGEVLVGGQELEQYTPLVILNRGTR
jgi:hypothetical protein